MSDKWKRSQVKMKNSAVLGKLQFWLPTTCWPREKAWLPK